jgi:hypothetical protein
MARLHGCVVLFAVAVAGCQGKPKGELPPLHPAKGKIVRGGEPVNGGSVRLQSDPDVPDIVVTANVGADGTFELETIHATSQKKGAGAPTGTFKVMYYPPQADQVQGKLPAMIEAPQKLTIHEGPNELTVELPKK